MIFPPLKITEHLSALIPIVQGGMAIRVSRAPLAAAVANCGGVGVIAASGMQEDELREQIRLARTLQTNRDGLIAVNIMFAAREFNMLANVSIEEGIDLIIFGAGFSRDIFGLGKEANVPIVPIVSSPKLAVMSKKLGASAIVVESGEAGGHLGTCKPITELIPEIQAALQATPSHKDVENVSVIAAGGITSGMDIMRILKLGADGVQMATRFVLSKECDVSDIFKEIYLKAKESDIIGINSPVGLPARALLTPFTQKLLNGMIEKPKRCIKCLKHCTQDFCIINALQAARDGDWENGLFFTGANLKKYTEILSVKEIFDRLEAQAKEYINQLQAV